MTNRSEIRRDTCPDLFGECEHFDELVGYDLAQLRLAELKRDGAVIYSMTVGHHGYVLRGRKPKSTANPNPIPA